MIGVETRWPSSVTPVSTLTMSRRTRGRRRSRRHAVTFSAAVISSSAPVAQKANEGAGSLTRACSSRASKSTQSIGTPCPRPSRAVIAAITEMRCPARRARGRLGAPTREFSMANSRPSTADKRRTFRKLHESGCFVIPNTWNVGSARYLQGLGFKALATTSSGHAHAQGYADGDQSCDDVLAHFTELAEAADVPLNADFENG